MNKLNALESKEFFEKWKRNFQKILYTSFLDSKGYFQKRYYFGIKSKFSYLDFCNKKLIAQNKFQDNFLNFCKKHNMLKRYVNKPDLIIDYAEKGEHLFEWIPNHKDGLEEFVIKCSDFYEFINIEIKNTKKEIKQLNKNNMRIQKKRTPIPIVWEILKILHQFSGDKDSLDLVYDYFIPNGECDNLINKVNSSIEESIDMKCTEKIKNLELQIKRLKSPLSKKKIYNEINVLKNIIENSKKEVNWNIIKHLGNNKKDTQWANHRKEHCVRALISENKLKIVKNMSKIQRNKIIQKIEIENKRLVKQQIDNFDYKKITFVVKFSQ